MSQLFTHTHMHVMQMSTAAHPDECTADAAHNTAETHKALQQRRRPRATQTWKRKTTAVNTDLPVPQDSNYCGTQVSLLPSLLLHPWSYKLLLVCQNSSCFYGLDSCRNPSHFLLDRGLGFLSFGGFFFIVDFFFLNPRSTC